DVCTLSDSERFIYYVIAYSRDNLVSYVVYHDTAEPATLDLYDKLSAVLNALDKSMTANRTLAGDNLQKIMNCLKTKPSWTSTHIAAHLAFEIHFKECRATAMAELNVQSEPDLTTPLHVAIKANSLPIVKAIVDLK